MERFIPITKDIPFRTNIAEIRSISIEHNIKKLENNSFKGEIVISGDYRLNRNSDVLNQFSHILPVDIEALEDFDLNDAMIEIEDFSFEVVNSNTLRLNVVLTISGLEALRVPDVFSSFTPELDEKEVDSHEDVVVDEFYEVIVEDEPVVAPVVEEKQYDYEYLFKDEYVNKKIYDILEQDVSSIKVFNEEKGDIFMRNEEVSFPSVSTDSEVKKPSTRNVNFFEMMNNSDFENFETYSVHVVQPGDSVESILVDFGIPYARLAEYNDLANVEVGAKLIIPAKPVNE